MRRLKKTERRALRGGNASLREQADLGDNDRACFAVQRGGEAGSDNGGVTLCGGPTDHRSP